MSDHKQNTWEVRVAGPDDLFPHGDELWALRHANAINRNFVADCLKNPDDIVLCVATVHGVCQRITGVNGEPCGLEPECPDCGRCSVDVPEGS